MWGYVISLLLLAVVALLVWLLDTNLRCLRKFEAELATREPLSDNGMVARCIAGGGVLAELLPQVRKIFAEDMNYPSEKLMPDEDLGFFWHDLDLIYMVRDLEKEFGIEITQADLNTLPGWNILAVSLLVASKADRTSCST